MTVQGVDLSNYQGSVSPQQAQELYASGVRFAYVLATDGAGFKNPDAPQQVNNLRAAGIEVGYYHFLEPADTTFDQVTAFLVYASSLGPTKLPLALDCESYPAEGGWQALASQMVAFAMQIEAENNSVLSRTTLFYVNLDYYESLPGFPWGRQVWLADPNPGAPHQPCLILQGAPRAEGPFSSVDPDTFLGTEDQWQAFISGSGSLSQPAEPQPSSPTPVPTPGPEPVTSTIQEDEMALAYCSPAPGQPTYLIGLGAGSTNPNWKRVLPEVQDVEAAKAAGAVEAQFSQAFVDALPNG